LQFQYSAEGLDAEELELELIDFGAEEVLKMKMVLIYAPFQVLEKELENRNLEILSSGFERIPQITKLTEAEMADVEN
jgi:transcriptional/translational regulatory protein YebC/TACO1